MTLRIPMATPTIDIKPKVAIYIRVSTHWQVDKDSLQVQRRELIAYAEMVLGISDYEIFEDPGYSAKNTERPDYKKMMNRLRTGEFSHLLVWKIDRISRNLLDFAYMYQELKSLGVTFVSKNEQFDTSSAIGEAMLKIILVFAELERNMTSERVSAVMLSRANNGQWNGGRVPYGYTYDKETKAFSIDPQESKVVKLICDLYEQNQSILYVCRYLNSSGITTRAGKQWSVNTVHKILKNPFYIGEYRYNLRVAGDSRNIRSEEEWVLVKNHHEPIISKDQHDRIVFLLERNRRGGVPKNKTYIKKNIHMFAGLLKCGNCGNNMSATLDRRRADGWRPSIYGCSTRRHNVSSCKNKYISDITLGPFVFNYIANVIRAKDSVSERTTKDVLQRKLLRGEAFQNIDHIDEDTLDKLYELLVNNESGLEYKPSYIYNNDKPIVDEKRNLEEKRKKSETALNRLKTLYLYGDENLPEKDFIIERERILNHIKEIDEKLSEIQGSMPNAEEINDEFVAKASYFIMVEKLLDKSYIDYERYIRNIEPGIPKNFLTTIIEAITVLEGKITAIKFKNGIEHKFFYKK